ncbi:hypothetical protein FACS18945_3380 [Bacteroidia bacterium]|nr:hypothetical protein FACS18945_3380 [Bacteroidia bacterium]
MQWLGGVGDAVLSAAVGYLLGFIMYIVFKRIYKKDEPIGFGDVKLLAAGGAWLGLTLLPYAIVVAAILGAAWGLTRKQRFVPFAPFFFAGAIIALTIWCVF